MLLPCNAVDIGIKKRKLRPVVQDDDKVMVAMQVANKAVGQPGRRVVRGKGNSQVGWKIADIGSDGLVKFLELGVDSPVFALTQFRVRAAHGPDIANDTDKVDKVPRHLILGFISTRHALWNGEINSIHIDGEIVATLGRSNHDFASKNYPPNTGA